MHIPYYLLLYMQIPAQTAQGAVSGDGLILDAMEAIANASKYPEFAGNVAAVVSTRVTPGTNPQR